VETVLLIGNFRASVSVVRSLGRAGYRVLVAVSDEPSFAELSRYCSGHVPQPVMETPETFVAGVKTLLEVHPEVTRLFPVDQERVALMARCRDSLPPQLTPVMADSSTVELCLHKTRLFGLAEQLDIPVARYALASDCQSVASTADDLGYPCIVRPAGDGPKMLPDERKAIIARGRDTLAQQIPDWPEGHEALLVQRYLPGVRHGVYFAALGGRILARVEVTTGRTDRRDGTGYAVEGVSVAPDPNLHVFSDRLVAALGYTGIGCLQFLRRPDGSFHFLELNPRIGGNGAIAVKCGLDMPLLACDLATGRHDRLPREPWTYPAGLRYTWTFGDIQALRKARQNRELTWRDTCQWAGQILASAVRADIHLVWSLRDPLPAIATYAYWAPFGLGRWILSRREAGSHSP